MTNSDVEFFEALADASDADFRRALTKLLNHYNMESGADTPDFILSNYMLACLRAYDEATRGRDAFYKAPDPEVSIDAPPQQAGTGGVV